MVSNEAVIVKNADSKLYYVQYHWNQCILERALSTSTISFEAIELTLFPYGKLD